MERIAFIVAIALVSSIVRAGDAEKYIGLVYPPAPSGLIERGGGLAGEDASSRALWYAAVEIEGKKMVWLQREVGRMIDTPKDSWPRDRAVWRVEDVLPFPVVRRGETIHFGNDIECSFQGKADTSIIAVGKWAWRKKQVGGYAHHIRLAWRIAPNSGKFEAISPRATRCELNEDRD